MNVADEVIVKAAGASPALQPPPCQLTANSPAHDETLCRVQPKARNVKKPEKKSDIAKDINRDISRLSLVWGVMAISCHWGRVA